MKSYHRLLPWLSNLFLTLLFASCINSTLSIIPTPHFTPSPITTATIIPTPTTPSLPEGVSTLKIDGIITYPELDPARNTWVWRNKQGEVRRLLDPASHHILARTSSPDDFISYEIDLGFSWEANLTNFLHYGDHAPFGSGYLNLLSAKYPQLFPNMDKDTGIVFRILFGKPDDIPNQNQISFSGEVRKGIESVFIKPIYLAGTNEYIFTMFLPAVKPSQRFNIITYTDWMLNYCISAEYPKNPSGAWGVEIYKHPIK